MCQHDQLLKLELPVLKGMSTNPGIEDYRGGFS